MSHSFLRTISMAFLMLVTTTGLAQTAPNGQTAPASAEPQPTRDTPRPAPTEGAANDTTVDTGDAYSRSGGSLMRAARGVEAPASPGDSQIDPRIADISFFAVPPPPRRVIRQHDLITVIIKEQSEFKSEGTTKIEKDADLQAAINQFIRLNLSNMELENIVGGVKPTIDLKGEMNFEGNGTAERTDSVSVRMQAEVVDVKPNGNLVLQARRRIKTEEEDRLFLVSGIVRVEDVTTDNTVLSTQIYDFDLVQETKGVVRQATKRGWVPRLLDALNPF